LNARKKIFSFHTNLLDPPPHMPPKKAANLEEIPETTNLLDPLEEIRETMDTLSSRVGALEIQQPDWMAIGMTMGKAFGETVALHPSPSSSSHHEPPFSVKSLTTGFLGDPATLEPYIFLVTAQMDARPHHFASDRIRVLTLMDGFGAGVLTWAKATLMAKPELFEDYRGFVKELEEGWGNKYLKTVAVEELTSGKFAQGVKEGFQDYLTRFRLLSARVGDAVSDSAKLMCLVRGLEPGLKAAYVNLVPAPTTLAAGIDRLLEQATLRKLF
jgi:hypothetical protein